MVSSGMRPERTRPAIKSNSVAPALGKPTSISLMPTFTSRSNSRVFFSGPIGSISAWLPSRRSVESQRGADVIVRDGHCRSSNATGGKGRYFVAGSRSIAVSFVSVPGGRPKRSCVWQWQARLSSAATLNLEQEDKLLMLLS